MTNRIYVLTAEYYHESSRVLGAFLELDKAVKALVGAQFHDRSQPSNWPVESDPEGWQLQAFEDAKPLKALLVMTPHVLSAEGFHYKIVREIYPHGDRREVAYEEVDPFKFNWSL